MDKKKLSLVAAAVSFLAAALNLVVMVSNYRTGIDTGTVVLNGMAALMFALAGILELREYFRKRNTKQ